MPLFDRRLVTYINWELLACFLTLFVVGVGNLYSASGMRLEEGVAFSSFYQRQMIWGSMGFMVMICAVTFDYRKLHNLAWPLFVLVLILLSLVPLIGVKVYGAQRWLSLGFMNLQPSELAKLAVLILGAHVLSRNTESLGWIKFIQALLVGLVPCALIITQPDLGTSINVLLVLGGMIIFHGLKGRVFKTCMSLFPFLVAFMWFVGMKDYQRQRVLTFLNPGDDPRGAGYHIMQSQIAIGSGQIWGKGFFEGTQSQLRFVPERHSDFVIAVFGEEWGFVGCVALIFLYCLFLLSIYATVVKAKDRFGSLLCVGVFFYFFWQIVINMGMVIGLMPVVGIPLPFMSYGGSSMIVNCLLLGIVLNVSMRRFMFKS